jgi:2-C-methyl-D-erythritol 2,4-cyclodiphosphate synthase
MEIKIGQGYDIHKLINKRRLVLGNIIIPYHKGFLAHSDGDVLIHALIDALLGAANLGDIGTLFPDNDPIYKNIDSKILLSRVLTLIQEQQYRISNLDATVICQKPRLKEFIPAIKTKLASILGLTTQQISIKAKTKEKMDAVGRGKAVEVFAVCLLIKT